MSVYREVHQIKKRTQLQLEIIRQAHRIGDLINHWAVIAHSPFIYCLWTKGLSLVLLLEAWKGFFRWERVQHRQKMMRSTQLNCTSMSTHMNYHKFLHSLALLFPFAISRSGFGLYPALFLHVCRTKCIFLVADIERLWLLLAMVYFRLISNSMFHGKVNL